MSSAIYAPSVPAGEQVRGPKDYHLYSLDELVGFVNKRSLGHRINATITPFLACIEILLRADAEPPFRFLDLPPELRNMVYGNLLTIDADSITCHPQILRTCKQIHGEGTNILYAENLITVEINQSGVRAHGFQCGDYVPVPYSDSVRSLANPNNNSTPKWPDFIRRAWKIEVRNRSRKWYSDTSHTRRIGPGRRTAAIEHVLYSLCSDLSSHHRSPLIQVRGALPASFQKPDVQGFYYPLRFLGKSMILSASTSNLNSIPNQMRLQDDIAHHQAEALREGVCTPQSALLCKFMEFNSKILSMHKPSVGLFDYLNSKPDETVDIYYATIISTATGLHENIAAEKSGKSLAEEVAILRNFLAYGLVQVDSDLWLEAKQLLLLEIEIRSPGIAFQAAE